MLLEIVTLVIAFLSTIYWLWTRNFDYWKVRGIPGPEPSLLYGNTKSVFLSSKTYTLEVEEIYNNYRNRGCPVVGYFAGRKPHILVTDAFTTKEILIKSFTHFNTNEVGDMMTCASDPIISKNPFFQRHADWQNSRKELVPAFTSNRIKTFHPILKGVCGNLNNFITEKCKSSTEMDIDNLTARFTTDAVSDVIFGINANALTEEHESMVMKMGNQFITQFQKVGNFFAYNNILPMLKRLYKYRMLEENTSKFFQGLVQSSLAAREQGTTRNDFFQYLVKLKETKGINIHTMTGHAMTFYLNGYDTSSIAMASALQELARHQWAQDKLRAEIEDAVQEGGGEISFDKLMDMEYLNAVTNESLRLRPPIAILVKQCTKTFQLIHPDHTKPIEIPQGTPVLIHVAATNHDALNFEKPLQLIPERFISGDAKKWNEEGMLVSFGGGARICLGMKFALAQIKMGICEVIQNFRLTEDPERVAKIPMGPANFLNTPSKPIILNVTPI